MNNGDMPASPLTGDAYIDFESALNKSGSYNPECQGLTKREAFAMVAMQGLLSSTNYPTSINGVDVCEYDLCAQASVKQADALLKELSK